METNRLKHLYVEELKDLYSAENQMVKALPKMAKAAASDELRSGFEEHLEQTKGHVARLEQIFQALEEKPTGKKCMGMEGLIKEGGEAAEEDYEDDAKDAALIGAAQRVEHYEIAAYGTVRTASSSTRNFPPTGPLELFVFSAFYATLWTVLDPKHIQRQRGRKNGGSASSGGSRRRVWGTQRDSQTEARPGRSHASRSLQFPSISASALPSGDRFSFPSQHSRSVAANSAAPEKCESFAG